MSHTIALPAVLNAQVALQVQQQLLAQMQAQPAGSTLVFNAAAVESFDSAGLALLLSCRRHALQRAQVLCVEDLPPRLTSLAQVYGVLPLLTHQP